MQSFDAHTPMTCRFKIVRARSSCHPLISVLVIIQKSEGSMSAPRELVPPDPKAQVAVLRVHIEKLVSAAEGVTSKTCIVCGKPGKTDSTGGY
jgi:hypothetical protein